jgi:hypothetical protein
MGHINKMILSISPAISEYKRDLVKKELQNEGLYDLLGKDEFYIKLREVIYKVEGRHEKVLDNYLDKEKDGK